MSDFIKAFEAGVSAHPFARYLRVWQNKVVFEVRVINAGTTVHLGAIQTLDKGLGHGSEALEWLKELAKTHGMKIDGHVQRLGKEGLTYRQLCAWYRRHGFKVSNTGKIEYCSKY